MKNLNKINRLMEWFWLVVGIVSLIAVAVITIMGANTEGAIVFVFPCLAFLMFFLRRTFRKKMEKNNQA